MAIQFPYTVANLLPAFGPEMQHNLLFETWSNDEDAPNSSFQKIAGREKYLAFIASKFKNNFLCHDKAVHPKRFVLNETCLFVTIEV